MPDPGVTRPDLCSKHAAAMRAEPAEAVRGGLSADGHPLVGDEPPTHRASGIDRAIRLSTAAAVLAVAGIAAYVSYGHAYAVVRAHGATGITARLEPTTIDGLVYASSMLVVLHAARHRVPAPSLARWLLALGIAATLTANMAQGWSHGPAGAVVTAWPAVSLVGSYELPGLAHPHLRGDSTQAVGSASVQRCDLPWRSPSFPLPAIDGERSGRSERGTPDPGVAARGSARRAVVHARPQAACR